MRTGGGRVNERDGGEEEVDDGFGEFVELVLRLMRTEGVEEGVR